MVMFFVLMKIMIATIWSMSDNGLAVLEDINGDSKRSHDESTQHQSLALNSITRCIINPLLVFQLLSF